MAFTTEIVSQENLYDRVSKLLESFEWSDCTFSICGRSFKAHKLLLGISSPVFKAMLYGPLASEKDIIICDIEPEIFQLILNYVYTDKVDLSSVEQAFELLYAAKKYMLQYLVEKCKEFIEFNITVDNVISVLNYADYLQEKKLFNQALALFCSHSDYLLDNGIENISVQCLKALLECNNINSVENTLISAVFQWTSYFCKYNNLVANTENKRRILIDNGLLQLLRFFVLSNDEFENIVKHNILLRDEIKTIKEKLMINHKSYESNVNKYESNVLLCKLKDPRYPMEYAWSFCHRFDIIPTSPLVIDNNCNKVYFRMKANKTIFVKSFGIRSRMSPEVNFRNDKIVMYSENFRITILQEFDNKFIKGMNYINTVEHDSPMSVEFGEPCVITKDTWYKISFIWPNNLYHEYKYMVSHRSKIFNNQKVKIEFDDMIDNSDICGSFILWIKYSF